ncbi:hypothetical protein PACTADRAFT_51114 [Pachysolen tannophilus NRRL Y-2460]|uniref:Sorting nexin-4 n=1 Tax=Pachysolen tannophilus NRRL Y-2460 TaxID=669874 RepID=A0A1E4TR86_PACTA|nr:hypothetical protein PACTADRAFT_51114 [Pachysolen tannophilus NRRL Y-2460]
MADEFSSVQWDRDDPVLRPLVPNNDHSTILEADDEQQQQHHHQQQQAEGEAASDSVLARHSLDNDNENGGSSRDEHNHSVGLPKGSRSPSAHPAAAPGVRAVAGVTSSSLSQSQLQSHSASASRSNQEAGESEATGSNSSASNESYYIHSTVSDPLKESDGANYYISYLIVTSTNNPAFQSTNFKIRRRFSDFNFLYQCLLNDFPTVIVPPLPNKQRLEYIKGDRFSENFTKKRAISLNNFLQRISKSSQLSNSKIYHIFLENSDYWNTYKQTLKINNPLPSTLDNNETFSDYIMNAFKKPTIETENSKEFQEMLEKSNKLQENLLKIDKIYSKVLKRQNDLSSDFNKFGDEFLKLNKLINEDNTEESSCELDQPLVKNFQSFAQNLHRLSKHADELSSKIDYEYLTSLKDLEHYIIQLKSLIKLKDSKLIDYEALTNYLNKAKQEKQSMLNGGSGSATEATVNFLSKKLESFLSSSSSSYQSQSSTNDRILKLNLKINNLEKATAEAFEIFKNFEKDILREFTKFEAIKDEEINENLIKLSRYNLNFYENCLNTWEPLNLKLIDDTDLDKLVNSKLKLNQDSKFFDSEEISKNERVIEDEYNKLVKNNEERKNKRKSEADAQNSKLSHEQIAEVPNANSNMDHDHDYGDDHDSEQNSEIHGHEDEEQENDNAHLDLDEEDMVSNQPNSIESDNENEEIIGTV